MSPIENKAQQKIFPVLLTARFEAGQNIFWSSATKAKGKLYNWAAAIDSWSKEMKDFSISRITNFVGDVKDGHFTQVIWAKSLYLGCGRAKFKRSGSDTHRDTLVCNYGPG